MNIFNDGIKFRGGQFHFPPSIVEKDCWDIQHSITHIDLLLTKRDVQRIFLTKKCEHLLAAGPVILVAGFPLCVRCKCFSGCEGGEGGHGGLYRGSGWVRGVLSSN